MKKMYLPLLTAAMLALCGCSGASDSGANDSATEPADSQTEAEAQEVTEGETEPEAEPPTQAPFPDADANAVTFDDGDFSFAAVITDTPEAAEGTLSVDELDGNMMLHYTDTSTTTENMGEAVQKIQINASALLAPEDLERVASITFDMYGVANDAQFVNEDGEKLRVPGCIAGGGGSVCADEKWYGFSDFTAYGINEYDLERSDAYEVKFQFLLAASGKRWDASMDECDFLIMRWSIQNISDTYIDNITFYDADGNSIPLAG